VRQAETDSGGWKGAGAEWVERKKEEMGLGLRAGGVR